MKKKYLLISFLCITGFTAHYASAQQPNILVIISDDQHTNTISCYGGNIETPAIDRIANEGVRYTREKKKINFLFKILPGPMVRLFSRVFLRSTV